jgi:hypothetical protein
VAKANALTAVFVKQCKQPGLYRDGQGLDRNGAKERAGRESDGHRTI